MRKFLLLGAFLMLFSLGAFAQKSGEAYVGYSFLTSGKNGLTASAGVNLARQFQVDAEYGGYFSHNNSINSFMFGFKAQAAHKTRGFLPWGRFLIGPSHVSRLNGPSDTAVAWAIGAGLDAPVHKKFSVRISADAFHTHFNGDNDFHLRAGAGVVYHF